MTTLSDRPQSATSSGPDDVRLRDAGPGVGSVPPRARFDSGLPQVALDGEWRFQLSGSLGAAPAGVGDEDFDDSAWGTIPVPSSWPMHGHGSPAYTNVVFPFPVDPPDVPDADPVGDHRRRFDLPAGGADAFTGGALLRFDGVDSAGTVWVNGHLLGTTRGSRLTTEFEVGPLLRERDNLLVVRVLQFSAASYLEDQDMWWLPGIFRSVALLSHPPGAIRDVFVHADWADGRGRLAVEVDGPDGSVSLAVPELGVADLEPGRGVDVGPVRPWSAERPALYDLQVTTPVQQVTLRVGFRTVTVRDARILVNDRPVLFRGVNRHEHHPDLGRVVPADVVRAELHLMKRHNVNAIRTSHYPPHPDLPALADELGFWLVDECDLETHGFGLLGWEGNPSADPAYEPALLDRMARTVERDKNHPCVVMWSLGNESGVGGNLAAMARWSRERDPSRPVHYEGDWERTEFVDVWSRMYASPEEVDAIGRFAEPALDDPALEEHRRTLPFMLCEYAHAMGNGPGGLSEYQAAFEAHPRNAGGFVWEWVEHGIRVRTDDGRPYYAYGGDFGEPIHDGAFVIDGLVSADRVPRPGLLDVKKVVEPVRMILDDAWRTLRVHNRHDVGDLSEFAFEWQVTDSSGTVAGGRLAPLRLEPGQDTTLDLPDELTGLLAPGRVLTVSAVLSSPAPWADAGHEVAWTQAGSPAGPGTVSDVASDGSASTAADGSPSPASSTSPSGPVEGPDGLTIGPGIFDPVTGLLRSFGGVTVSGPELGLWRAPTDNDLGIDNRHLTAPSDAATWAASGLGRLQSRTVSVDVEGAGLVVVRRSGTAGRNTFVDVTYRWSSDGTGLDLTVEAEPVGPWTGTWARIGVDLVLPATMTDVAWAGLGPGPKYPDTGQAQRLGWFSATVDELQVDYARPQENGARAGVTWLRLADPASGRALTVEGAAFSFTARPWSQDALAAAKHPVDLAPDGSLHLLLDHVQHGIGTASCGPGVLPPYRLNPRSARFALRFS